MHIVLFHFYSKKPNPVYQEISASLRQLGHTVWVGEPNAAGDLVWKNGDKIVGQQPGPQQPKGLMGRLPLVRSLATRWQYWRFANRVKTFLRQQQPDIVQINPIMFAWWLPRFMPRVMHFILDIRQINEAVKNSRLTRFREKQAIWGLQLNAALFYEHTCFCHAGAAERILGANWQRRGTVVPVGVDDQFVDFLYPETSVLTKRPPVSFIYVGTLSPLRNLERLIEAAQLLRKQTNKFQLDLVGPDTANGYYQRVVEKLGVQDVVAVKPPVPYDQIPHLLAQYDVGLAYVPDRPTWHYQPTIKILEYRAMGLPIISTDVASHREVVENAVNGALTADLPEAIAAEMHRFVCDPSYLTAVWHNAQAMRQGNTWHDIAVKYDVQVYQKLKLASRGVT